MKMTQTHWAQNHFSKHDLVNPAWKLCNQEDDMAGEVILEYMYLSSTQHLVSQIDITLNEVFWVGHHSLSLWNMTIELDIVVKNLLNKCFLNILVGILNGDLMSIIILIRQDVGQFWVDLSAGLFWFICWLIQLSRYYYQAAWLIRVFLFQPSEVFFRRDVGQYWVDLTTEAMLAWTLKEGGRSHWYLPEFSPTFQHN